MIRSKPFTFEELTLPEIAADGEEQLLLIDDAIFVNQFAEAGQRRGRQLVCVRCFDPARPLGAVVLMVDDTTPFDESAGSVGFCGDCYRDLAELLFHDSVLRASKSSGR